MPKFPLLNGAYSARSVTAACQRCVNLYAEKNPDNEVFPLTLYPTPGLRLLNSDLKAKWRCLYAGNDGVLYGVNGGQFVSISPDFVPKVLGELLHLTTGAVSMVDNGVTLIIVHGSSTGY